MDGAASSSLTGDFSRALPSGNTKGKAKRKAKAKAKAAGVSPLAAASALRKSTLKEFNDAQRLLDAAVASADKVVKEAMQCLHLHTS